MQVPDKSAVERAAVSLTGEERDTLPTLARVFLRDELQTVLGDDAAPPGHALRGTEFDQDEQGERETEPSVDTMLLRDALLAVGNNHGQ